MDFKKFYNIINNNLVSSTQFYQGVDPTTAKKFPHDAPVATRAHVDDAVAAARAAFPAWSATSMEQRRNAVGKYVTAFRQLEKEFVDLLALEGGKPMMTANWEIQTLNVFLDQNLTLEMPEEVYEDDIKKIVVRRVPVGIVAAICPWNLPILLSVWKIVPALLAGNCVIVKPSPYTPYTALKVVELGRTIFPPGVLQVLGGNDDLGPWMVQHEGIDKISFTGSVATGKKIVQNSVGNLKRVTLELGGNDPCIVCQDVDIEKAAAGVAFGSVLNTGQGCVLAKRIYVHQDIYDQFLDALTKAVQNLKVGSPHEEEGVVIGPIQNAMQYAKVRDLLDDCHTKGYRFALGGGASGATAIKEEEEEEENPRRKRRGGGFFISPCIIDNPPENSRIMTEEAFGPIIPVVPWSGNEEDVIHRANGTNMGLGGSVFAGDIARAESIARRIESGTVWINTIAQVYPQAIFSGHKQSGLGTEAGVRALESFTNAQSLVIHKV